MCYNILNNLVDIDSDAYFKRSKVHHTRGNTMKLNKSHASSVRHGHFFTHRIIINKTMLLEREFQIFMNHKYLEFSFQQHCLIINCGKF